MAKKNIIHINHTTFGGPGRVVNTIYDALEKLGYDNYFVTVRGESKRKVIYLNKVQYYISRVLTKITEKLSTAKIPIEPEVFCFPNADEILFKMGAARVDAVILYWYKNTVSAESLDKLLEKTGAKLYIYLMDEGPMTGGCHYHEECTKYQTGCGNCPSFAYGLIKKDITYINVKKDKDLFEKYNATVICPTTLARKDVDKSFKLRELNKTNLLIPLSNDYLPQTTKENYRKKLEISADGIYLFFGSNHLNNPRKGMVYLLEALEKVYYSLNSEERKNVNLLIAGEVKGFDFNRLKFNYTKLGFLDYSTLIDYYHAADFLVSSTTVDMGPMMVNEAIRSGLPVICFNIGVSYDLVINGCTGYRVDTKDVNMLADSILKAIRMTALEREVMSANCISLGEKLLSEERFNIKIKEIFV
ncbi:glycosyltransferase [Chryseobacterium lacus]|uniref:glycosyltransferase n=1 Tax=Chryseobacterium lacus TaxID=2058346 RepID=UPI000F875B97|nr:glycosyltransferase [Chryseobacterium lacus]RST26685.1 glycosyltransferase [Chryseobacterium lacus]